MFCLCLLASLLFCFYFLFFLGLSFLKLIFLTLFGWTYLYFAFQNTAVPHPAIFLHPNFYLPLCLFRCLVVLKGVKIGLTSFGSLILFFLPLQILKLIFGFLGKSRGQIEFLLLLLLLLLDLLLLPSPIRCPFLIQKIGFITRLLLLLLLPLLLNNIQILIQMSIFGIFVHPLHLLHKRIGLVEKGMRI